MSVYVAIPCMDMVQTEFFKNVLTMKTPPKTAYGITVSSLTYDARNTLAKAVVQTDADRVLWLDSDMTFDYDVVARLSLDIDEGRDFVTGLYFTRKNPLRPVIFNDVGYNEDEDGMKESYARFFDEYPKDTIFEVKAAGFGVCMTTTKLIKQMLAKYGSPFTPLPGFGEDISFCQRCTEIGVKMYCDSRIKAGHLGTIRITEETYRNHVTL